MTPEQYAVMKPCDHALVRVELLPNGRHDGDAGDYVKVRVSGSILWVKTADIVGVLHPVERAAHDTEKSAAHNDAVIAALCGPHGRKVAA